MKKLLVGILVAILVASCSLMIACGEAGTYKFESLTYELLGVKTEVKVGESYKFISLTEDYMTVELKSDKTAVITSSVVTGEGTWEVKDNKVIITSNSTSIEFTKSGKTLTFSQGGLTYVLSK